MSTTDHEIETLGGPVVANYGTSALPPRAPVLFLVFNRPDVTAKVFEAIRAAQPPRLYVAADGPRPDKTGEAERVAQTRQIATAVDWPCEVHTLFRDENLGCKMAVSGAITWFFEHEERGIILEDDCLPAPSFFPYCEALLERYKDDTRIWHISGTNPLTTAAPVSNEYHFSRYCRIWGWATWRRAWSMYDVTMADWPAAQQSELLASLLSPRSARHHRTVFSRTHSGKIDTWDYQWFFVQLRQGLSIDPGANLISNLGFGETATHTFDPDNPFSQLPTGEMHFPLQEPPAFHPDARRDLAWERMAFGSGKLRRLRTALSRLRPGKK